MDPKSTFLNTVEATLNIPEKIARNLEDREQKTCQIEIQPWSLWWNNDVQNMITLTFGRIKCDSSICVIRCSSMNDHVEDRQPIATLLFPGIHFRIESVSPNYSSDICCFSRTTDEARTRRDQVRKYGLEADCECSLLLSSPTLSLSESGYRFQEDLQVLTLGSHNMMSSLLYCTCLCFFPCTQHEAGGCWSSELLTSELVVMDTSSEPWASRSTFSWRFSRRGEEWSWL